MKLYHGSNMAIQNPQILASDRKLDFGTGFYLTSSLEQAERWAELTADRRGTGKPTISVYEFDETKLTELKVLKFEKANKKWLDFVVANRDNTIDDHKWDMVIGPVANDRTMPVIRLFIAKVYTAAEALRRLLPQNLHDQYTFKTQAALQFLQFQEVIENESKR
ncbi:MAG: DUF3990 domain-containing protein [Lentisphaeria bacterium]|nr:DUF3990 domain-containing protein [Lentisphaeria bacterium]